jgi:TonB family protein
LEKKQFMRMALVTLILTFSSCCLCLATILVHPTTGKDFQTTLGKQTQTTELEQASLLSQRVAELYREGKAADALPLARQVLALREKTLGMEHESVGAALSDLATIYTALKQPPEAEPLFQRALTIAEKRFGTTSTQIVPLLTSLAFVKYESGNSRSAEELFNRALSIQEKALGKEHNEVGNALHNLARFYFQEQKYDKALDYYQRAIAIREKLLGPGLGPQHAEIGQMMARCACTMVFAALNLYASTSGARANLEQQAKRANALVARANRIMLGLPPDPAAPGDPSAPKAKVKVPPVYPPEAKMARSMGPVVVAIEIDESGMVTSVKPVCGVNRLIAPSVRAAEQWRFEPSLVSGKPAKVSGFLFFNFTLQ